MANKEANKNYDASVKWSPEEQKTLDEFNDQIKSEEMLEKECEERMQNLGGMN